MFVNTAVSKAQITTTNKLSFWHFSIAMNNYNNNIDNNNDNNTTTASIINNSFISTIQNSQYIYDKTASSTGTKTFGPMTLSTKATSISTLNVKMPSILSITTLSIVMRKTQDGEIDALFLDRFMHRSLFV